MAQKNVSGKDGKEMEKPIVAKTAVDLQRLKLIKLMKNPDKPVLLPERPKSKNTPTVPEFVRNVMGSSAGAGSGEFHVYRHLRRKEYSRQKFIQEKGKKELLDDEYHRKLEENKETADRATAKRRAKRLKRKQKQKQSQNANKKTKTTNSQNRQSDESDTLTDQDSATERRIESESERTDAVGSSRVETRRLYDGDDVDEPERTSGTGMQTGLNKNNSDND